MRKCAEKSRSEAAGWMERGGIFALCRQGGRERRSVRRLEARTAARSRRCLPHRAAGAGGRRRRSVRRLKVPTASSGRKAGWYLCFGVKAGAAPCVPSGGACMAAQPAPDGQLSPTARRRRRALARPQRRRASAARGMAEGAKEGLPLGPRGLWRQPRSGRENGPSTH